MRHDWLETDYTGVGYDGVLTNFTLPGCWVTGKYNNGLQFDGTDDWVDLPIDEDLFYDKLQERIASSTVKKKDEGRTLDVTGSF